MNVNFDVLDLGWFAPAASLQGVSDDFTANKMLHPRIKVTMNSKRPSSLWTRLYASVLIIGSLPVSPKD